MAESIRETIVQYQSGKVGMKAFVAAPQATGKRPPLSSSRNGGDSQTM